VRFEHLSIDAEAYVGNRGLPTFTNFFSNKVMVRICRPQWQLHEFFLAVENVQLSSFFSF